MDACPICGSPRDPHDRFCRTCGATFTAEPVAGSQEPLADSVEHPSLVQEKPKRGRRRKKEKAVKHEPAPERRGGAWIVLIVIIPIILLSCSITVFAALVKLIS